MRPTPGQEPKIYSGRASIYLSKEAGAFLGPLEPGKLSEAINWTICTMELAVRREMERCRRELSERELELAAYCLGSSMAASMVITEQNRLSAELIIGEVGNEVRYWSEKPDHFKTKPSTSKKELLALADKLQDMESRGLITSIAISRIVDRKNHED